jgi:SpoVK/Ycf46/Vps4 family AAA+-type ATPase
MAKAEPFRNSLEHILAEMKRVDLMLRRAVLLARSSRSADVPEEFRGLVISEENVNHMVGSVDFVGENWKVTSEVRGAADTIDVELQRLQEETRARMEASAQTGQMLTLSRLADVCSLSPAEVDVLLVALAPELEPRYETLYAYLQNDVTRKRPSVDLVLNLICRTKQEKISARQLFYPDAPLLSFRLVELQEETYDRRPTLLRRFMKIEDAVTRFLLAEGAIQNASADMILPHRRIEDLETTEKTKAELQNLSKSLMKHGGDNAVVQLWGSQEAALLPAAEALAAALGRNISYLDLSASDAALAKGAARDALLWDNILVLDRYRPETTGTEPKQQRGFEREMWEHIGSTSAPVIVLNSDEQFGTLLRSGTLWRVEIQPPSYESRRYQWQQKLGSTVPDLDADRLADMFTFDSNFIGQTGNLARALAAYRDPDDPKPMMSDVLAAGRDLTTPNLQKFAVTLEPKYDWSDLVLPQDRIRQLRSITARLKYRALVHRDWGFGEKMERGRGLCVLFSGPSGTGKTMSAEILAKELSLRLFQIDLSTVVSKYYGETEQHLSIIFREAELSQSLLFFDEADSLFSKRTEVKDAHDRYANLEVNYLLQRIEQYRGLVVLATNFQKNLDEAFLRRLQYVLEFPFPDEQARAQIWKLQFPANAPRATNIDFEFLGTQFKLSGASIRSVALEAAFLAAEEGGARGEIKIEHVIEAIRHEHQKQGKLVMKTDLGPYARVS